MKIYPEKYTYKIKEMLSFVSAKIMWHHFPDLIRWFYRTRRLRHSSVVLLIHEGLGDLASMAAAIKEASNEHKLVYVVARKNYFNAISLIFQFNNNVRNIPSREGKFKNYIIPRKRLRVFKRYGYVIKIGLYARDPIFGYPDSFYLKLGYPISLAARKTYFNFSEHPNKLLDDFLKRVGGKYVFISNETTTGCLETSKIDEIDSKYAIVIFSGDLRINRTDRVHDIAELNKEDFTRSLLNSLYVCCLAEYAIVSDAGLFNILIRLENKSNLRVLWRRHLHDLNKEIYGKYIEAGI